MIEDLDIETETTLRLPEHELLLSFVNDSGAEKFQDWWHESGKESFEDYCKENSHKY
uniref:Uncharacterized protein n=1 Tax=Vibrio phage P018-4 TaxID=3229728 RepID=A0AB39AJN9_9CAUD